MVKNSSQLKIGSLLSYGQMILYILIGLLYTPVMIRLLGQSEYGLYNTVSSTISMLSVLNLGFTSGYIRYYAKYKKEENADAIGKLNGLFLIIFSIIGVVAFLCGLFLSFNLTLVFDNGLTSQEYDTAKILMLLLSVNLALSFSFGVFSNIVSAHEKFIFLKLLGMVKTVFSPLITLPILLLGFGSVALVIVNVSVSIVVDLLYAIYVKVALKQKFAFGHFERGLFKSLFVYSGFIAINLIVDQVNWNIDKFLLGRYQGTISVAVYSVGYSLYQYYMTFSSAISSVFTPRIHRIVNETIDNPEIQKRQLTDLFIKVGRIQFLILGLLASGVVFFGQPFIYYWAGNGYEDSYYVALLLIIPASIALIQNLGIEIQRAENKHQFRSIVYLVMALVNLGLSIVLCQKYGAIGSAIGTAISLIVANGLIMNIYYQQRCNINILAFWKSILRMSVGLIIPVIFGVLIVRFINLYKVVYLLLCMMGYVIIYSLSMWLLGMNDYEKQLIKRPLLKVFKRSK